MRPIKTLTQHTVYFTFLLNMSKSVMLSLLNRAADGNQLLSILDSLIEESGQSIDTNSQAVSYITGEAIEF